MPVPVAKQRSKLLFVSVARSQTILARGVVASRRRAQLVSCQRPATRMVLHETRLTVRYLKREEALKSFHDLIEQSVDVVVAAWNKAGNDRRVHDSHTRIWAPIRLSN